MHSLLAAVRPLMKVVAIEGGRRDERWDEADRGATGRGGTGQAAGVEARDGTRGGPGRGGEGRGETTSQAGRHGKIFFIAAFVLSFSNTFVSFSTSTELQANNNKVRLVLFCYFICCLLLFSILFFFSGRRGGTARAAGRDGVGRGGPGRAAGRDGAWWDGTVGGRGVAGRSVGQGRMGQAADEEGRPTRGGAGRDKQQVGWDGAAG